MSHHPIDLPFPVDRSKRRKVRYAIILGRLLHLTYLALKHSVRGHERIRERIKSHETFEELVRDGELIRLILRKEAMGSKSNGQYEVRAKEYLNTVTTLKERGYDGLLRLMDIVFDLSFRNRLIDHGRLCSQLLGVKYENPMDRMNIYGKVICGAAPFRVMLQDCRFFVIEAEHGRVDGLSKTVVYLSSLRGVRKALPLGLFTRLSIRGVDADHLISKQRACNVFETIQKYRVFPTVLRMQRLAYKRIKSVGLLREETHRLLSDLYVDDNTLTSIMAGDVNANLLAMVPSISLNGALCIPLVYRGELIDPFGGGRKTRIRVADLTLDAYTASFSIFEREMYPGEYIFLSFHPLTAPRLGLVLATYPLEELNLIRPRRRNVNTLDSLFPRVSEVIKSHGEDV